MRPGSRPVRSLRRNCCTPSVSSCRIPPLARAAAFRLFFCSTTRRLDSQPQPRPQDLQQSPQQQEPVKAIPYSELSIGVPTEVRTNEKRVAITPQKLPFTRKILKGKRQNGSQQALL